MAKEVAVIGKEKKTEVVIPKILIGVPILAWTHEFAESFLSFWTDLMTYSHKGRKFHVGYRFIYRTPVHKAEEQLAQLAVDSDCTHLLLMDDDIYDVKVADLLKLLDADKDVVAGIMFTSGFPYAMCAFRRYDVKTSLAEQPLLKGPARLYEVPVEQRKGLQKVDLIPFGFTLIKTRVFKGMKKPWFSADNQAPTDSWFADRMLTSNREYFAHFDVWLNHRGINRENQPLWVQMGLIKAKAAGGAAIELTPLEMKRHEAMMTMKLAEAEALAKKQSVNSIKFMERNEEETIGAPVGKALKEGEKNGK